MEAIVQIKRDGKWFVATDLVTYVADQGLTREEAIQNLQTGLREHYKTLFHIAQKKQSHVIIKDLKIPQFAK
ncbi:MAG: hypothetical protein HY362_00110 [Candidatus Aenigmarchaeota archaeon]|nr:hypothetical protein [Candidatus Aenigmarchaeota archaeon]